MADRPYLYLELTNGLCSTCLRKVEAKVVAQDERVYLLKFCPEHGHERVLIATDLDYHLRSRRVLKPGQLPRQFNTRMVRGCPYDCGICPDHEQHGCVVLVEITDHCNLRCPVCYAASSPQRGPHRSLEQVEFLLDCAVRNEGEPDVVQISGGEPTTHPDFFAILKAAKARPIRHLMVNTNGVRIAADADFARRLADYRPGFEVYLQCDALDDGPIRELRGANLAKTQRRALDRLNELGVSTTLVATLKKGTNDDQIGALVAFALEQPCVRGVTFQPVQVAGRTEGFDPARDRLTLSEVRTRLIEQSGVFRAEDVVPVPCHPDCLAMAYALKLDGRVVPLTTWVDPEHWVATQGNTIMVEQDEALRKLLFAAFSTAHSPESSAGALGRLLCCLPEFQVPTALTYENVFRVLIVQFLDAYNFDVRSVKKSCIHIVHPDGRLVPFDTYDLFYRDRAGFPDPVQPLAMSR